MPHEVKKYLFDIQCPIDSIFEFLGSQRDFNAYLSNKLLRRAVERELEIIGEAAKNLLQINNAIAIENARKIIDLRNFISHGYDKADDTIIWGIISKHPPLLKKQVENLLEQHQKN
ncbi:MAG: DUF86 domain-containing protein [Prevotellaceae bacterium]|jgi:uncharacterized protein with HEPN domain|nr:DUF86 domain-containing protein [Prevotellaceae bacterium]